MAACAGSGSYIYALGPVGRRIVGASIGRQIREPSLTFVDHCLAIVDTHIVLIDAAHASRLELVEVQIEPASWRRFASGAGITEKLRPDMYLVTARGSFEYCWFLEVDCGTEYRPALVRKCRQYERYWRTGLEQQRNRTFPRVVWVAPDPKRSEAIQRAVNAAPRLKRELFRVTTRDNLVATVRGDEL